MYIYIYIHTYVHTALSYSLPPSFVINPFFRLASIILSHSIRKIPLSLLVARATRGCQDGYANRVTDFHPWKSHNLWERRQYPAGLTPLFQPSPSSATSSCTDSTSRNSDSFRG